MKPKILANGTRRKKKINFKTFQNVKRATRWVKVNFNDAVLQKRFYPRPLKNNQGSEFISLETFPMCKRQRSKITQRKLLT
jgi:hypothetical protein